MLLFLILSQLLLLFSQVNKNQNYIQKYFKIQQIILLDSNLEEDDLIFKSANDTLFYLGLKKDENNQKQYILGNNFEKEVYSLDLKDNNLSNYLNNYKLHDFTKYYDTLIITISNYLLFFIENGDKYELIKSIKLDNQLLKIDVSKNILIGYVSSPFHSLIVNKNVNTYYYKLDLNSYKSEFIQLNNPEGLLFMLLQPRYLLNMYKNMIVQADAIGDSIIIGIYDYFLEKYIRRIAYKPDNWIPPDEKDRTTLLRNLNEDSLKFARKIIELIRPKLQKFSTIIKIDFLNDTTLLIFRSSPRKNYREHYDLDYFFDILVINSDKTTYYVNLQNQKIDYDKPLKNYSGSWNIGNTYYLTGNNIVLLEPIPFIFDDKYFELSVNELKKKIVDYYSQFDKIGRSIIILKFQFNEE